ncbi:MAG: hypothetical protein ACLFPS_05800 [Clostridia bacterium]
MEVRIKDSTCFFRSSTSMQFATIDGLKLDKAGVIKEFPDLKENKEWRKIAIKRFKTKMKGLKTEKEQAEYVLKDLTKFGWQPISMQKQGHRPIKLNG